MTEREEPIEKRFCIRCGAENFEHHNFCATCGQKIGEESSKTKSKGFKFWIFCAIGLIALLYLLSFFKPASQNVVSDQLKAIREGRNTEAYYAFTSKEYQKKITLPEFRKFLEQNPQLISYKTIQSIKEALSDPNGTWEGTLLLNDGSFSKLNYQFVKEDGQWKVLNITTEQVTAPLSKEASKEAKLVIDHFFSSLKKSDFPEAYYKNTTKRFQEGMSLSAFEEFLTIFPLFVKQGEIEIKQVSFEKDQILLDASIRGPEESYTVQFILEKSGGDWKIKKIDVMEKKSTLSSLDPKAVLEIAFKALRNHEFAKAYYEIGSKEFRETTPYKDFIRFVKATPTIYNNKQATLSQALIEGELATIEAELVSIYGEKSSFQVEMIEEEGSWRFFHMVKQG